jgi:hypothetical protein
MSKIITILMSVIVIAGIGVAAAIIQDTPPEEAPAVVQAPPAVSAPTPLPTPKRPPEIPQETKEERATTTEPIIPEDEPKKQDSEPSPEPEITLGPAEVIARAKEIIKTLTVNEAPPLPEPRDIFLRSVVALICEFEDKKGSFLVRGSGVITHPDGYLLTNRHIVDQAYTAKFYGSEDENAILKNNTCKVYFPNFAIERTVPPEPQFQYDFFDIQSNQTNHDFTAKIIYLPGAADRLSEREEKALDFALMKLDAWNTIKHRNLPELKFAPILASVVPVREGVVLPGYAVQAVKDKLTQADTSFSTIRLLTKTGTTKEMFAGDQRFGEEPIEINLEYGPDVYGGRSGAPIFWNGYVVGILKTRWIPGGSGEKLHAPQVAIFPVMELLKENGLLDAIAERY